MSGNHAVFGQRRTRTDQLGGGRKGEAETHYVAPSLKREDGNVGFGTFPTVCKAIPRFSRPKIASGPPCRAPVLAMYLRVPAPNYALRGVLIGVDSNTHDQLTRCDTGGQRETPVQPARRPRAPMDAFLKDGSPQNDRHPGERWPLRSVPKPWANHSVPF